VTEAEETVVELNIKIRVTFFSSLANDPKESVDLNMSVEHNRLRT